MIRQTYCFVVNHSNSKIRIVYISRRPSLKTLLEKQKGLFSNPEVLTTPVGERTNPIKTPLNFLPSYRYGGPIPEIHPGVCS